MPTLRDQIIYLTENKPKHFSKMIQNNPALMQEISSTVGDTVPKQVYNYIHGTTGICKYGNKQKLKSINDGYVGCGPAGKCQCAREAVSASVSATKKQFTPAQNAAINAKRAATNTRVYGVENIGQTEYARSQHALVYQDKDRVAEITLKIKQTKKEKYNDENYQNVEQIKKTYAERDTGAYLAKRHNNPNYITLNDKDKMAELCQQFGPVELAKELEVSASTVYKYLNKFGLREPYTSYEEKVLRKIVTDPGHDILTNKRNIVGKELDVYVPAVNVAIEYNGIYWHNDKVDHITPTYHLEKFTKCKKKGINLITIFSDTWADRKEQIKQTLAVKLGKADKSKRIYARKCKVQQVDNSVAHRFVELNSMLDYRESTINYGLYYQEQLVAVMSFLQEESNQYQLTQYVNGNQVVGGASKLLSHFNTHYNPTKLFTISDNEVTDGKLFETLGFKFVKDIKPDYWYYHCKKDIRYSSKEINLEELRKLGFAEEFTEEEITDEMDLLRVWDCGKKLWALG